ncbi:antibiotic biosynthesis monooxygenase [Pelagerythrobacter marensis]|uniref:Antibiotic biosynthesis monooxygenase n=1 Tax=Pelagerythrobacter marensis TaxID=543877 RepID=A0ABZ2D731_9SPHN
MYGLIIEHRALAGRREDVEAVWAKHMKDAIAGNPGHRVYAYSYGPGEDRIVAFQVYDTQEQANDFLKHSSYKAYLAESRPLLARDPVITVLDVRWLKR